MAYRCDPLPAYLGVHHGAELEDVFDVPYAPLVCSLDSPERALSDSIEAYIVMAYTVMAYMVMASTRLNGRSANRSRCRQTTPR